MFVRSQVTAEPVIWRWAVPNPVVGSLPGVRVDGRIGVLRFRQEGVGRFYTCGRVGSFCVKRNSLSGCLKVFFVCLAWDVLGLS